MHLFCSVCVCVYIYLLKELTFVFLPGWSGSPMSRDLCRSSSCLKTHSRPTQLHRELSNKYPYWAVDEWEGVHCTDNNIVVVVVSDMISVHNKQSKLLESPTQLYEREREREA